MADTTHQYLTWKLVGNGPVRQGETAQFGCRIAAWPQGVQAGPTVPDPGAGRSPMAAWNAQPSAAILDDTLYVIDKGHNLDMGGVSLPTQTDDDIRDIMAAAWAFWNAAKATIPGFWTLSEIKLAPIGAQGKYPATTATATILTPKAETRAAGHADTPAQLAMCVTLGTRLRGKGSSGRMFIPYGGSTATGAWESGGNIQAARITPTGNAAADFVKAVRDVTNASLEYRVVVVNRASLATNSLNDQLATVVDHVRIGNEPDVQQRRRNATPETYTRFELT